VTISVGIFVIGNEFISQTKVDLYFARGWPRFESGCIVTLHAVMGTTALGGGVVTVCGAFL
jgi:hypothetical protein